MSTASASTTAAPLASAPGVSVRSWSARLAAVFVTLAIVRALWHLLTAVTGMVSPARFPTPAEVWAALRQIALSGYGNAHLHEHVLRSVLLVGAIPAAPAPGDYSNGAFMKRVAADPRLREFAARTN
jgi:hypothetical protein